MKKVTLLHCRRYDAGLTSIDASGQRDVHFAAEYRNPMSPASRNLLLGEVDITDDFATHYMTVTVDSCCNKMDTLTTA